MEPLSLITAAVAPIVMVSATGLLFIGIQTKNLHLADRMRELAREHRDLPPEPRWAQRREDIEAQLCLFERRIRLSQRALELLYIALVSFIITALLLAAMPWLGLRSLPAALIPVVFVLGMSLLLTALVLEFLEMRVGLLTIHIETRQVLADRDRPP